MANTNALHILNGLRKVTGSPTYGKVTIDAVTADAAELILYTDNSGDGYSNGVRLSLDNASGIARLISEENATFLFGTNGESYQIKLDVDGSAIVRAAAADPVNKLSNGDYCVWLDGSTFKIVGRTTGGSPVLKTVGASGTTVDAEVSIASGESYVLDHTSSPDSDLYRIPWLQKQTGGCHLLLHFDGSDGSTTFTDSSSYARTVTPVGGAQIDTAQSKFGGASGLFDGSGDRLTVPSSGDFTIGTNTTPFTIEFWIRFASVASTQGILQFDTNQSSSSGKLWLNWDSTNKLQLGKHASSALAFSWTPSVNTWYHVAVCRDSSSDTRAFIDGTQIGTTQADARTYAQNGMTIGDVIGSNAFNGWLDDLRVIVGTALRTVDFTAPASALGNLAPWYGATIGTDYTVKFADSSGDNPSTKTTFTNATGSAFSARVGVIVP